MAHARSVVRVVLVDPSPFFRRAFCRLMALTPGIDVVADVVSVDKAIPLIRSYRPDVVLLDETMVTGQIAEHLRAMHPNLRVVGMTTFPLWEAEITEAAHLDGWLLKGMPTEDLIPFLQAILHGTR